MRTKYSEVLPDGSFTPPPYIVVDVLCTCDGVPMRVLVPVDAPDLRMIVPRSQPFRCAIFSRTIGQYRLQLLGRMTRSVYEVLQRWWWVSSGMRCVIKRLQARIKRTGASSDEA